MNLTASLFFKSLVLVLSSVSIVSCTQGTPPNKKEEAQNEVHPLRKAEAKVEDSFVVKPVSPSQAPNTASSPGGQDSAQNQRQQNQSRTGAPSIQLSENDLSQNQNSLVLKKSALRKAFLLSPTMIIRSETPIIDHLAPKVVSFEMNGDQLALFELNTDAVYDNYQTDRLLESFKIKRQDDQVIEFDIQFGLSAIPLMSLFSEGMTDYPGEASQHLPIMPIQKSFIRKLEVVDNNLEIEQISEVQLVSLPITLNSLVASVFMGTGITQNVSSMTVKLNFNLRPYRPSTTYQKRESAFRQGIGAFETVLTRKENGARDFYSTLWDLSPGKGPLIYALTKGTPDKYVQAIKEGILYWNKVAGREIIQVETNADPEETPKERKVLVHWVPFEQAGFARASMQADPLTGEIIRADVYLTSAFAAGANMSYQSFVQAGKNPLQSFSLVPQNFQSSSLCHYGQNIASTLDAISVAALAPDQQERYVLDQLRNVTAHEVGHTLGLRHNFAGSLTSELETAEEIRSKHNDYIQGRKDEGAIISSTVMDYIFGVNGGMVGASIKNSVLEYDQKFMEWSYVQEFSPNPKTLPPFCSDGLGRSTTLGATGCQIGDAGKNAVNSIKVQTQQRIQQLLFLPLQSVVTALYPKDSRDKASYEEILNRLGQIKIDEQVEAMTSELKDLRKLLSIDGRYFVLDLEHGRKGWANSAEYETAYLQKLTAELESVGGIPGFIQSLYPMENELPRSGWLKAALLERLNSENFQKGTSLQGVSYTLTSTDIEFMARLIDRLAPKAEEAWLAALLKTFSFKKKEESNALTAVLSIFSTQESAIRPQVQQAQWWPKLAQIAKHIVTATNQTEKAILADAEVELPQLLYSKELRKKMISNLVPEGFLLHEPTKKVFNETLKAQLALIGNVVKKEFKSRSEVQTHLATVTMDTKAKIWFDTELEILKDLEAAK